MLTIKIKTHINYPYFLKANNMRTNESEPKNEIHEEEYRNEHLFKLRMERLEELGYSLVTISQIAQSEDQYQYTEDAINILKAYRYDVVKITYENQISVYKRPPESPLPTAAEDFEKPLEEDTLIKFAISMVKQRSDKTLN